jgi:hypothetical protein
VANRATHAALNKINRDFIVLFSFRAPRFFAAALWKSKPSSTAKVADREKKIAAAVS